MAKDKKEIISEFKIHIEKEGSGYGSWYVGISKDARDRLNQHGVPEKNAWFIYRQAATSSVAREIEDYFVNSLGTDGGTGGGDETADMVYGYKKTVNTNP